MLRALLLASLLFLGALCRAEGVPTRGFGPPPNLGTATRDMNAGFKLPPLRDGPGSELATKLGDLQAGQRALALKLDAHSAQEAWQMADKTLGVARERLHRMPPTEARTFAGARASELNALLRDPAVIAVRVTVARLEVDEPVLIRRANLWLDLGSAELHAAPDGPRFLVRIENATGVMVEGGAFLGGQWGLVVSGGRDVTLRGGRYDGLRHGGVVLTNTPGVVLARARLTRIGGAPVLVHGDTAGGVLLENEIVGNLGPSNWHAGIVLSDRHGDVAADPHSILNPDRYGAREQPIQTRLHPPRRNVLVANRIAHNASSGIYSDGSVESVIFNNTVEGNSKEGICLDNGSTACVLAINLIRSNGQRWGKTDEELRLDFVDKLGRMTDGTAIAKTPGLSLDNSLYNIVYANHLERNYGGGVKLVRTAFFNTVGLNTLVDNNEGANERFHFFGIELGAATADVPVEDLDFTPSRGNLIFGNTIRGPHYAGIFFGVGSTDNDVFDNTIFGATNWAMEQARVQPNSSLNNLTNLPSRNIDAGLDVDLLKASKGRYE